MGESQELKEKWEKAKDKARDMYLRGIEMIHLMYCMCVTKRKNKQTMQCILHGETIPLHASFTLLFVFIPPSISKTWLKCSSFQRLCWTRGKKRWDWGEKKMKRKSQKHLLKRDALYPSQAARRKENRNSNFFVFPCLPLPLFPILLSYWNPPDTWGQPRCTTSSIASKQQHYSHTVFS